MKGAILPERVVVLRCSRFVGTALDEVRRRWPSATLRVVYQAGSEADLVTKGVTPDPRLCLPADTRLSVESLHRFGILQHLSKWQPQAVVVQWWWRDGLGHEAVNRAALFLHPRRLHAVMSDGTWLSVGPRERAGLAARRLCLTVVGACLVAACAFVSGLAAPALYLSRRRERLRLLR